MYTLAMLACSATRSVLIVVRCADLSIKRCAQTVRNPYNAAKVSLTSTQGGQHKVAVGEPTLKPK